MSRQSSTVAWNALKNRVNVERLEDYLDIHPVSEGTERIAPCPLPTHPGRDRNPSFSINEEKQVFNCFTCGEGGSLVRLIMLVKDLEYSPAVTILSNLCDEETDDSFHKYIQSIIRSDETKMEFEEFPSFNPRLLDNWLHENIDYLGPQWIHPDERSNTNSGRGISSSSQAVFKLGLDSTHYRRNKNGDEYIGRAIIIPHFVDDKLVGYQEGWLDDDRPKFVPKYTNTRNFPKGETIFNCDRARESADSLIFVVESALTVAYLHTLGYTAVATFGAESPDSQLECLLDFSDCDVVLAYDNDDAGRIATSRALRTLKDSLYIYTLPPVSRPKGDLNDLSPEEAREFIEQTDLLLPSEWHRLCGRG